ncbi:hypothetical protein [Microbacterium binotii]|uniref:hypothetical protein n=1 Tax=Microbacterium binotii TaxID=462710 RepID=UPI001F2EE2DB|nr:hypothetical protein [Microbacterium binotii]UIN30913.1 hypothetical protein LXM64_01520 [Microbacterium binotii]
MADDEQIGRNLVAMRGKSSQKELADWMRQRGFKWSQATVWSVEKGERPLRLSEAEAVSDIYGADVSALLRGTSIVRAEAEVKSVTHWHRELHSAFDHYRRARLLLAAALDESPETEVGRELRMTAERWIDTTGVDVVLSLMQERLLTPTELANSEPLGHWMRRFYAAEGQHGEHQETP